MYSVNSYSMTEIDTIRHLYKNEKLLPSELAALTRIKTQSMSQILNKMESRNMIKRDRCEIDRRKVYISLTGYGREMVLKTRYDREEWLRGVIEERLSGEECQLLESALPVLKKLTENK
jgi:DNA-binding MarR family transcriptional regulator